MKLHQLITSLETSLKLQKAGIKKASCFSYYKKSDGNYFASETDINSNDFVCFTCTSEELINILPSDLILTTNHYRLNDDGREYVKISKSDVESDGIAQLITFKNKVTYFKHRVRN